MMATMLDEEGASDTDLIGLARDGDRLAFGELVGRHYEFIHRVAWRWCGNPADAEDVAQDVCARLGRAIRGFNGSSAFRSWLYAMTINAARDARRKAAREATKLEAFGVHALVAGEPAVESDDPAERLWAAVRQLPDKQRDAVLLVHGEGLSHAAAGEVMSCAEATISWHIHEAKKRLKVLVRSAERE